MSTIARREFLVAAAGVAASGMAAGAAQPSAPTAGAGRWRVQVPQGQPASGDAHRGGPVVISSLNGLRATARAMDLLRDGYDPADAIVQGVKIIEDDPEDDSVGYGGLPNADGVVELDASVMHGPTHKSGAVASIRNIKNPAHVALLVLRRTDHCLLVGEGALRFAKLHGFKEEDLLTEHARQEYLHWRENMSKDDDWLNDDERDAPVGKTWDRLPWQSEDHKDTTPRTNDGPDIKKRTQGKPFITDVTGTVHCSALTAKGDVASCTSTSGLNWKIPGRVGDSPIIGAGNYCDNAVGAAGCTGRGESAIVNLSAYSMVRSMEGGMSPEEACLDAAKRMLDRTKEKRLKGPDGKPNYNVSFYALRKDGAYGAACLMPGGTFSVHDGTEAKVLPCTPLLG